MVTCLAPLIADKYFRVGLFDSIVKRPRLFLASCTLLCLLDMFLYVVHSWWYNPAYCGAFFTSAFPLEEVLFFFTTPYALLFIYTVLSPLPFRSIAPYAGAIGIILLLSGVAIKTRDGYWYTATAGVIAGVALITSASKEWIGRCLVTYGLSLIPFIVLNGVLTSLPVVIYNPSAILGYRIGSIPIEDFVFSLIMTITTIAFWECERSKQPFNSLR
jgi:lycopene cyclase domain-containing protein